MSHIRHDRVDYRNIGWAGTFDDLELETIRYTPMKCTLMRCTPVGYTSVRYTLMEYTPMKHTPMRYMLVRCTPVYVRCTSTRYTSS
jgi:hypothetical protein